MSTLRRRDGCGRRVTRALVGALGYIFFTQIPTAALIYVPGFMPKLEPKVGYCTTADGALIAYATVEKGPPEFLRWDG